MWSWPAHKPVAPLVHPRNRALTRLFAALLAGLFLAGGVAMAQPKLPSLQAAAVAAPVAPAMTPAEVRQMLDLLNDPQKRAAFTATLQTLAKAGAVTAPAPAAAAGPVKLAPNSVGAQVLTESSTWITQITREISMLWRGLDDLPAVWTFTVHAAQDPATRARALEAARHMAAILGLGAIAELLLTRLLRRPLRAVAAGAGPQTGVPAGEAALDDTAEDEAHAMETDTASLPAVPPRGMAGSWRGGADGAGRTRARVSSLIRTLRQVPYILAALLLDLLPLGLFLAIAYLGAQLVSDRTRDVLQAVAVAYGACRLATCLARMVFSPVAPALRLAALDDASAMAAVGWVRRLMAVGAFGFAAREIGRQFALPAGADEAFLKAVFLVDHVFLIVIVLQCRGWVAARIRSSSDAPGLAGVLRNRLAAVWHLIAIFYIAGLWFVWAADIRGGYVRIWHLFVVTAGVLAVTRIVMGQALGLLDRNFGGDAGLGPSGRGARYYRLLRGTVRTALLTAGLIGLLEAWGISTSAWFNGNALGGKLASLIAHIALAGAVALAVWESVNFAMDQHLARLTREAQMLKAARLRTLQPILRTLLACVLVAVFTLNALDDVGVNIAPLLAGAGILGVAIGFGSQKLVQDFITGIFLLLENAMQVGDWVTVAGLSGTVEHLSIRTMRLRASDGSVHIIPFSAVSTVTNVNRGVGNAAVSVSVPVDEDIDLVCATLVEIAKSMRAERRYADMMRSDLQLWGVDKVEAGVATVAGQIVCTDSGRWTVQREFNRRMMQRFKDHGLRIATPIPLFPAPAKV